ncbi:hypothetical protein P4O66_002737 [Electrophorus voltai]|uniref:Uncharacterized protein n=1 Tax=Electrophorus voltai TaxID=2609070 RepID=A0AAD9DLX9_9TELE|nr:hypothetical protein P4O66_002737 [Electrophorus voltai]
MGFDHEEDPSMEVEEVPYGDPSSQSDVTGSEDDEPPATKATPKAPPRACRPGTSKLPWATGREAALSSEEDTPLPKARGLKAHASMPKPHGGKKAVAPVPAPEPGNRAGAPPGKHVAKSGQSPLPKPANDNLPQADLTAVPNAVGIGVLVISMILKACFVPSTGQEGSEPSPADLLCCVFAEEKSSEVRNLMEEYLKRYRMHLTDNRLLLLDTKHLEEKLNIQLSRLRNSMLVDGHMNTHALKHWASGAAFHAQMLLHITRLRKNEGLGFESAKTAAVGATNT